MFAIPGLDLENTFLIHRGMPPMSNLMRYGDFLLHRGKTDPIPAQGGANPITIQPPFRAETIGRNLTMQSRRGYTIKIWSVAANNRTQLHQIEEGVLDFEWIEGPLHASNPAG